MDLEVAPLEIKFTTNIPNKQLVTFESALLYHSDFELPSNIAKRPYLISNAYFPEDALKNMKWDERISFFFNVDTMRSIMAKESFLIKEDPSDKQLVENRNIFIMIKLIFPTKYFVHKNIHQTLEYVTGENPERSFFFNPFSQQFSYMKLDGKKYTNIRVTWKNDLLNHPSYYELVKNTYEFVIKQKKDDVRITENYTKLMIEFNEYVDRYVSRMSELLKKYDKNMKPTDEPDYHTVLRIAIVNAVYEWINYENTDVSFSQIFVMNIKNLNNQLQNKIDKQYLTPRDVDFVSKPLFDMIEEKDELINNMNDPLQRKKAKLDIIFGEQELLTNARLMKKLENNQTLADIINEYTLYFEKQEEEMKILYAKLIKELNIAIDFQKYKRIPFLEVASQPEILRNNINYRRFFVNNIEKLLDTSSTSSNSLVSGNHKLYTLLHSNNPEDVEYFFEFIVFVYNKYILYKSVSPPLKEGFVENNAELIYTGVDNVNNKKQVYFIIDTIDGEVNDSNKRDYFCPFMNQYMGYLLSDFVEPNTFVKWKATPYNFIVSTGQIEETIKSSEKTPELVPPPILTNKTVDDNWEKFTQLVNIASREKIIDNLLYLKKYNPTIDETNEFAFIEQNKPSLFSALKSISKHMKKRDLHTSEFQEHLQRLKELASIHKLRFIEKSKQLENISVKHMDKMDQLKKEKLEEELYSIVANNTIEYFDEKGAKKGGRKTRKKVQFAKKKNIIFIE